MMKKFGAGDSNMSGPIKDLTEKKEESEEKETEKKSEDK